MIGASRFADSSARPCASRLANGEVGRVGRVCIASSEKSKIFLNEYKAAATQATFPV